MSKANQKFVQADEAVSPVIGVILMVAITVVLAAVVFVLVSNLSKTSDKSEDVAFKADSPTIAQIQITMIKMGTNGPYSPNTENGADLVADDVVINLDGVACAYGVDGDEADTTGEYLGRFGADNLWGAGETASLTNECDGTIGGGDALISSTEHQVQITVRGTLVFEGRVVVR